MKLIKEGIPFTMVANDVLKDKNLSFKAKGLYAYLFSKPDDWDFSSNRMVLETKDGRKAIMAMLTELEEAGYLERSKLSDGRMDYVLKHSNKALSPETALRLEKAKVPKRHSAESSPISNKELDTNKEEYAEEEKNEVEPPKVGSLPSLEEPENTELVLCDEDGYIPPPKKKKSLPPVSPTPSLKEKATDIRMRKLHPPFDFDTELKKLRTSTWKIDKIVALVWRNKNYQFENWLQFNAQLGKDRKLAKPLEGYSGDQIRQTIETCETESAEAHYEWGISTIVKKIANIVNTN